MSTSKTSSKIVRGDNLKNLKQGKVCNFDFNSPGEWIELDIEVQVQKRSDIPLPFKQQ